MRDVAAGRRAGAGGDRRAGRPGRHLHALAHNRDPRPVEPGRRRRSIGSQSALGRRPQTPAELDTRVVGLVDRVARRLRAADRVGRTVTLRLRFADFTRATRSRSLPQATDRTEDLLATARALLAKAQPLIDERGITLVGVAIGNLADGPPVQLPLPFGRADASALDTAVDRVRDTYGKAAVTRTVLLGARDLEVPRLPD